MSRRRTAQPDRLRDGLKLFAVFIATEIALLAASVLVLVPFSLADPNLLDEGRLPPWPLLALLIVPTVVGATVAIAGVGIFGGGCPSGRVRRELAVRLNRRDTLIGLAFGVGGLALTIPAATIWSAWVGGDDAQSAVGEAFSGRHLEPVTALLAFVVIWFVAPIGEEVIFRGVLWRAFEHWRWNRWLIFAVTSVAFSFAHWELLRTPLLLVLSIPLGLARIFTGNVVASVVAHQVNNFLPAVAVLLATTGWHNP